MVNINKLKIFVINIENIDTSLLYELFDYGNIINDELFVGLAIGNPRLTFEISSISDDYVVFIIDSFDNFDVEESIFTDILDYIGYYNSLDETLDLLGDDTVDDVRKFYLKSILYYKNNQKGKDIQKLTINVKHFDDLINQFPEDFISYEILNNNDDFSETFLTIETYLTKEELNDKFKDFLII
jgi:hypothetical protein